VGECGSRGSGSGDTKAGRNCQSKAHRLAAVLCHPTVLPVSQRKRKPASTGPLFLCPLSPTLPTPDPRVSARSDKPCPPLCCTIEDRVRGPCSKHPNSPPANFSGRRHPLCLPQTRQDEAQDRRPHLPNIRANSRDYIFHPTPRPPPPAAGLHRSIRFQRPDPSSVNLDLGVRPTLHTYPKGQGSLTFSELPSFRGQVLRATVPRYLHLHG
jgi:hypothetical protein